MYEPEIKGPATSSIGAHPPTSVGVKRGREEEEEDADEEDISGDYGEFEENGASVKKKARAAVEEDEEEEEVDE